jgi:hypothetical protein
MSRLLIAALILGVFGVVEADAACPERPGGLLGMGIGQRIREMAMEPGMREQLRLQERELYLREREQWLREQVARKSMGLSPTPGPTPPCE